VPLTAGAGLPDLGLIPLVLGLTGCGDAPPVVEMIPPRPSILWVTLDTTRADRLGTYGHPGAETPTLDGLAAQGVRFDRAFTTVPLTTPAHASMLTGLYPPRHGVRGNGDAVLARSLDTAPEALSAAGYRTGASVSAFVTSRIWQLDQGFDDYLEELVGPVTARWSRTRPADSVVDDAIAWLQEGDERPWLLWVHLYDPHAPYDAPQVPGAPPLPDDPYDAELAYLDRELARLAPIAEARAGPGGLAWVVVGDHGEALEPLHGELEHGLLAFNDTMRVPLILRPPIPLDTPQVVTQPVSVADVGPTLQVLAGLSPPAGLDGTDLSAIAAGGPREPVYMESEAPSRRFGFHPERAVVEGAWKLLATPSPRLFDLDADPGETTDLHASHPETVVRLRAVAEHHAGQAAPRVATPGPEVLEQLVALGYVSHDIVAHGAQALDVKDNLVWVQALGKAQALLAHGDLDESQAAFEAVLEGPVGSSGEAVLGLGSVEMARGRFDQAARVFEAGLASSPDSSVLRLNLAQALAAEGRFREALEQVDSVLAAVPGDDSAQVAWLRMTTDLGAPEQAVDQARAWLTETPDSHSLMAHLGVALVGTGSSEEAEPLLLRSREDAVARQRVEASLGELALLQGDVPRALVHWESELTLFPEDVVLWRQFAQLLMDLGEWEQAGHAFGEVVAASPGDLGARLGQAQAVFNTGDYALARQMLDPALAAAPREPQILLLHANLLAREGRRDEGKAVFEQAQRLRTVPR
jgi:arylsulfatase A-like enzyme/tetratricopeptide (TPR) repeat protein